jgi:hypothetical protein
MRSNLKKISEVFTRRINANVPAGFRAVNPGEWFEEDGSRPLFFQLQASSTSTRESNGSRRVFIFYELEMEGAWGC